EKYWAIREYEVTGVWPDAKGTISGSFEVKDNRQGVPVLVRQVRRQKSLSPTPQGPVDHEYILEYDVSEKAKVPEREFTLTAFGLPEPDGAGRGSYLYLWVTFAGVICIVLAVLLRRRGRRVSPT